MKIRALITDDEALARARVKRMLADETDVEIVGECVNGRDAVEAIQRHRPDLVFLDVQMPEFSGLDVVRELPRDRLPLVIFVTAHDRHAIEAFELHALDYLLKPFKETRFRAAMERARKALQSRDLASLNERFGKWLDTLQPETSPTSRISVRTNERTIFVKVNDVDYVESAANYVVLYVGATTHILRETLTNLEHRLPAKRFLRISRSTIVNLDRVRELQTACQGEHVVLLKDGRKLRTTRRPVEIQQRLESL